MTTAAEAFREINRLAAGAKLSLELAENDMLARQYLTTILQLSQDALHEALGDTETQVMDYAAGHLDRQAGEPT